MNDEELTRLAVAQLIAEGEKFKRRYELRYQLDEPTRLKPNLRYFKNTLKNCLSSNDRKDKIRKSKAAAELKCLNKTVNKSKTFKITDRASVERREDKDCHSDRKDFTSQKLKQKDTPEICLNRKDSEHKNEYVEGKKK